MDPNPVDADAKDVDAHRVNPVDEQGELTIKRIGWLVWIYYQDGRPLKDTGLDTWNSGFTVKYSDKITILQTLHQE